MSTPSWGDIRPTAEAMHPRGGEVCDLAERRGLKAEDVTCLSSPLKEGFTLYFGDWNSPGCVTVSSDELEP